MLLDLLYEIDVPKPWPGGHPHAQRRENSMALHVIPIFAKEKADQLA